MSDFIGDALGGDAGGGITFDDFLSGDSSITDPSILNGGNAGDIIFQDPGAADPNVLGTGGLQDSTVLTDPPSAQMFDQFGPVDTSTPDSAANVPSVGDRGGGFITGETAPPPSADGSSLFSPDGTPVNVAASTPLGGNFGSIGQVGSAIWGAIAGGVNAAGRAITGHNIIGTTGTGSATSTPAAQQQQTMLLLGLAAVAGFLLLSKHRR